MYKERVKRTLSELRRTEDLMPLIGELNLEDYFAPIQKSAERALNRLEKDFSEFPRIKDIIKEKNGRVKTLDSTIFKMLYLMEIDINKINDIVGLRALVENIDDCYKLFNEFLESGFEPYFRIHDSLDKKMDHNYRSLDVNFLYRNDCFQVQIRTLAIQDRMRGYLSDLSYKKRKISKFRKFLEKEKYFGFDYRRELLDDIRDNFRDGFESLDMSRGYSLTTLLNKYSRRKLDYKVIEEVRLNDNTLDVLRKHVEDGLVVDVG